MTEYQLDPSVKESIRLNLYKNVKNIKELSDSFNEFPCALLNPKLILDPFQIVIAASKALLTKQLTTKNIYTEIIWNLYPGKGIANSLKTFAFTKENIDDNTRNVLVLTLGSTKIDKMKINGEEVNLEELKDMSDLTLIKELYNITDKEYKSTDLLGSVITRIATKDL